MTAKETELRGERGSEPLLSNRGAPRTQPTLDLYGADMFAGKVEYPGSKSLCRAEHIRMVVPET